MDNRRDESGDLDLSFEFRKQRYCYLEPENAFTRLQFPDKVIAHSSQLLQHQ